MVPKLYRTMSLNKHPIQLTTKVKPKHFTLTPQNINKLKLKFLTANLNINKKQPLTKPQSPNNNVITVMQTEKKIRKRNKNFLNKL